MKNDDEISIFGNWNTDYIKNLMVAFEKCDSNVRTCKSEAEINAWIKTKYIVTMTNTRSFV